MLADLYLSGRLKIDELITRHYTLDDFDTRSTTCRAGQLARGVFSHRRVNHEEEHCMGQVRSIT